MNMKIFILILAIMCFGSFAWAMQRFFAKSQQKFNPGLVAIYILGALFTIWHIYVILMMKDVALGYTITASILYLLSLALFWWAIRTNFKTPLSVAFSTDLPLHLVKQGPYRIIRHPFYTSYTLTWIAGVIATKQYYLLISVIIMFYIYWSAARYEEKKFMQSNLANDYKSYCQNVGMFLPKLHKLMNLKHFST